MKRDSKGRFARAAGAVKKGTRRTVKAGRRAAAYRRRHLKIAKFPGRLGF